MPGINIVLKSPIRNGSSTGRKQISKRKIPEKQERLMRKKLLKNRKQTKEPFSDM